MKHLFSIILLLPFLIVQGQKEAKEIKIVELGWTLIIPDYLTKSDSIFYTKDKIEKASRDINQVHSFQVALFATRNVDNNLVVTTHKHGSSDNLWNQLKQSSKETIIDLVKKPLQDVSVIDTATTHQLIGGVLFNVFSFKAIDKKQNKTINTCWFYGSHKNQDISFSLSFDDENFGKEYLKILQESNFDK